jgi:branched-chain amino acid transport system ATP-binding protein
MPLLEARKVGIAFGGVHALDQVSFAVEDGEIFSIIGPNGAGKTTLYNAISGVYTPDSGDVLFRGQRITSLRPPERARLGIQRTFQNLQIMHSMTALENVMVGLHLRLRTGFIAGLAGLPSVRAETRQAEQEGLRLLAGLGLERVRDQPAGTLPYGMQKRLEIARALAARPQILLLDEPAAGLNTQETAEIGEVIRKIARERTTVVLVEHDMHLVMGISDRVLVLNFGRTLACGTPGEVSGDPRVVEAYLGTDADRDGEAGDAAQR